MLDSFEVWRAYEGVNGVEAAEAVSQRAYERAAEYGNLNGYETVTSDVLVALDVLRLVEEERL
jgi:hypothetical protein